MSQPDPQKQRADELRSEIEDLARGVRDRDRQLTPREFTDQAAAEAYSSERESDEDRR
jgi:hypothetical protein